MNRIIIIAMTLMLGACTTVGSQHRPANYYNDKTTQPGLTSQLLADDNDQKINELLAYRVSLPALNRIAILKLNNHQHWQYYSSDFTALTQSLSDGFIRELRSSEKVYDASFLPAMLIPEKTSINALREAAARFQADLLLTYRSQCDSYQKYRFLDPNESKAYCAVEAIVVDVRSGIIIQSVVSTQDVKAINVDADTNFSETVKKAELEAEAKSLLEIGKQVNAYLRQVEVSRS
ncbi:hypothetical protein [Thalassotalea sp. PS06]|uniref:hypothetical protein n=1 Tax=Thalassotalea sp. PS06 TaxID=2594005 RepID=UPI001163D01E|nr:hypothetical protein [Thalassotalea sp. PS06]QDP02217.1 hypothetical protein FNC98_13235 [Thalassotalea sp. PS06]